MNLLWFSKESCSNASEQPSKPWTTLMCSSSFWWKLWSTPYGRPNVSISGMVGLFFYHFNCVFVLCCMLLQSCSRGTLLTNISNYIDNLIIKIILVRKPKLILKHHDYQNVVLSCKTHLQFENRWIAILRIIKRGSVWIFYRIPNCSVNIFGNQCLLLRLS